MRKINEHLLDLGLVGQKMGFKPGNVIQWTNSMDVFKPTLFALCKYSSNPLMNVPFMKMSSGAGDKECVRNLRSGS